LTDIETAFYFGHPEETDYRLYEVQLRCYLEMGRKFEAQVGCGGFYPNNIYSTGIYTINIGCTVIATCVIIVFL
jgi:hypothetical protein